MVLNGSATTALEGLTTPALSTSPLQSLDGKVNGFGVNHLATRMTVTRCSSLPFEWRWSTQTLVASAVDDVNKCSHGGCNASTAAGVSLAAAGPEVDRTWRQQEKFDEEDDAVARQVLPLPLIVTPVKYAMSPT